MAQSQEQAEDENRYLNAAKEAWWANEGHRYVPTVKDDVCENFADGYKWRVKEVEELAAAAPVAFKQEHVDELRDAAEILLEAGERGFGLNSIADRIKRILNGVPAETAEPVAALMGEISVVNHLLDPDMQVEVTRVGESTTVKIALDTRNPSLVKEK